MTSFYLQRHEKGGPWVIDSKFHFGAYGETRTCDAVEWLEAKQKFGYALSPIQTASLERHHQLRLKLESDPDNEDIQNELGWWLKNGR